METSRKSLLSFFKFGGLDNHDITERAISISFLFTQALSIVCNVVFLSKYDAKGFMGKGVFHMNDIWFFAENIRINAEKRVNTWKKEKAENFR